MFKALNKFISGRFGMMTCFKLVVQVLPKRGVRCNQVRIDQLGGVRFGWIELLNVV